MCALYKQDLVQKEKSFHQMKGDVGTKRQVIVQSRVTPEPE